MLHFSKFTTLQCQCWHPNFAKLQCCDFSVTPTFTWHTNIITHPDIGAHAHTVYVVPHPCVPIRTHTRTHAGTHTYACTHVRTHSRIHTLTRVRAHLHTHIPTCAHDMHTSRARGIPMCNNKVCNSVCVDTMLCNDSTTNDGSCLSRICIAMRIDELLSTNCNNESGIRTSTSRPRYTYIDREMQCISTRIAKVRIHGIAVLLCKCASADVCTCVSRVRSGMWPAHARKPIRTRTRVCGPPPVHSGAHPRGCDIAKVVISVLSLKSHFLMLSSKSDILTLQCQSWHVNFVKSQCCDFAMLHFFMTSRNIRISRYSWSHQYPVRIRPNTNPYLALFDRIYT